MSVYYNDSEPFVCDWLENLIREKLLPDGVVDRRPIQEVEPNDVRGFTQAHFFAGIGGWAYALRLGGWPADRPVWTGSCPCQDLSIAGKQAGGEGKRHLWPEWYRLIAECQPPTLFGEQVASALGRLWLTAVRLDLEELGYGVGAADLCAASVGAPQGRSRLWFVADTDRGRREQRDTGKRGVQIADTDSAGGAVADTERRTAERHRYTVGVPAGRDQSGAEERQRLRLNAWYGSKFIACRDGKFRIVPTEPALFPLATGIPNRVGTLRGAGNSIVPQVAASFVSAYLEATAGGGPNE